MKTNIFRLAWYDYEESAYWLFTHPTQTEGGFKEDVEFLLKKYGEAYINQEDGWVSSFGWIEFIVGKMGELGYTEVKPMRWSFFGGYILGRDDEDLKEWKNKVGDSLADLAVQKNEDMEREMRDEFGLLKY